MKKTPRLLLSIAAAGMALLAQAQYTRNNVRLLSQVDLPAMPTAPQSGAGCVGYVSPTGKEYAIMGVRTGNVVYNITNPAAPVLVGHIPGPSSLWHEVCVLGEYAYATTEAGGGIQIIDLRQVDQGIVTLAATYTGAGISSGHTIQAVPNSKLIIVNGANGNNGGLRALDCQNPTAPVQVAVWSTKYVHDAFYKHYTTGPNAGKTICFAFCANGSNGGLYIIDVTTTQNAQGQNVPAMTQLGFIRYFPNATNFYSHSGVLSPDGKYILANDEFDEANSLVSDASTHVINVENLTAPTYAGKFTNPIKAIDHNSMVQDGFLFLAAYRQGLRVYNAQNAVAMTEAGFFDTYPGPVTGSGAGDGFSFDGNWGAWAGFPSGNVILSDMNRGLFVVDPSEAKGLGAPITNTVTAGFTGPGDIIKKLRKPDDNSVQVNMNAGTGSITVDLVTDSMDKTKVDFSVRAKSLLGRQETIKLYGTKQGSADERLLGTWELSTQMTTFTLPNLSGETFVRADGSVRLRLEIVSGKKGGAGVEVDLIKARVHG